MENDSMASASVKSPSITPKDLSITPRDRRFGRDEATPRWWHGGGPEASAFYNALSATFPVGEAFFVESVRKFRWPSRGWPKTSRHHQEGVSHREHLAQHRAVDSVTN